MSERKSSFAPVVAGNTRLLVLGSLPGEESLASARYYANPRNQFWLLIGGVIRRDLTPLPYEARLEALLAAGVGLWDTVASAIRSGSLDAAIRDHASNDVAALAATLPELRAIAFNGGRSAALGLKLMAGSRYDLVPLPSSSPAYTLPLAEKHKAWARLANYL